MSKPWLPFVYTSCPNSGWEIHSASLDLTPAELQEMTLLVNYKSASSAPPAPTEEQIRDFPAKHVFFRLASGRYGVMKSQYLGKDYTGRYGNFVAQAFIRDKGLLPHLPALYLNSPAFKDAFTFRDEIARETAGGWPLAAPNLPEEAVQPSGELSEADRAETIRSSQESVGDILRRVHSGKCLILPDTYTKYWLYHMQCWQSLYPLKIAHEITGMSHCTDPQPHSKFALLSLAEPLPGYVRSEVDRSQQFSFLESAPLPPVDIYVDFVESLAELPKENTTAFFSFLVSIGCSIVGEQLQSGTLLWRMSGGLDQPCTAQAFAAALDLGIKSGESAFFKYAHDNFFEERSLEAFFATPDLEKTRALGSLLTHKEIVSLDMDITLRKRFFWKSLTALVRKSQPAEIVQVIQPQLSACPDLAAALLEDAPLIKKQVTLLRAFQEPEKASSLLQALAVLFNAAQKPWSLPGTQELAAACLHLTKSQLSLPASPQNDALYIFLVVTLHYAGKKPQADVLEETTSAAYDSLDQETMNRVFAKLETLGLGEIVIRLSASPARFDSADALLGHLKRVVASKHLTSETKAQALLSDLEIFVEQPWQLALVITQLEKHLEELRCAPEIVKRAEALLGLPPWSPKNRKAIIQLQDYARRAGQSQGTLALAAFLSHPDHFLQPLDRLPNLAAQLLELEKLTASYPAYAKYWTRSLWRRIHTPEHLQIVCSNLCLGRKTEYAQVFAELLDDGLLHDHEAENSIPCAVRIAQSVFPLDPHPSTSSANPPLWPRLSQSFVCAFETLGRSAYERGAQSLRNTPICSSPPWSEILQDTDASFTNSHVEPSGAKRGFLSKLFGKNS